MGGAGGDVYIRERGYLSVHCLVTGHGPGPGTLAALPMHALSWTLEAALGQCSHAVPSGDSVLATLCRTIQTFLRKLPAEAGT